MIVPDVNLLVRLMSNRRVLVDPMATPEAISQCRL